MQLLFEVLCYEIDLSCGKKSSDVWKFSLPNACSYFFGAAVAFPCSPLLMLLLFSSVIFILYTDRGQDLHARFEIPRRPWQDVPQSQSGLKGAIKISPMMLSCRDLETAKLSALLLRHVHIL